MNEITFACPHCLRLNDWTNDDEMFETGSILECQHCKKKAIITKIRYAFETRKPETGRIKEIQQ